MPRSVCTSEPIDLLKELRLRRWARENYVPANRRDEAWHPVILDEMRAKEYELSYESRGRRTASSYVPLAPVPESVHLMDEAHAGPTTPALMASLERFEVYIHG
jgi:hypothetical protein